MERERGITVKAQSASLLYEYKGDQFLLNMIDTPGNNGTLSIINIIFKYIMCFKMLGHVDFSYEVTRSLRACQGVVLLVDANQGVQAQTVSNFYLAFAHSLQILAVLNKIDLPRADVDGVREQVSSTLEPNIFVGWTNIFL